MIKKILLALALMMCVPTHTIQASTKSNADKCFNLAMISAIFLTGVLEPYAWRQDWEEYLEPITRPSNSDGATQISIAQENQKRAMIKPSIDAKYAKQFGFHWYFCLAVFTISTSCSMYYGYQAIVDKIKARKEKTKVDHQQG
jgi:hypothetical protein